MTKEQLILEFAQAYEQLMETATLAAQCGMVQGKDGWGPREIVAHLTGWEVMASVRIPRIVAGTPPPVLVIFYESEFERRTLLNFI
jgi:hypothetical protein